MQFLNPEALIKMSESRREIMGYQALWAVDVNFLVLSIFFSFR